MARFSTAANAIGRIALRGAGNNRVLRAGYSAAQTTLRSFARVAHLLWLQITGVFFCMFALVFAIRLPQSYTKYTAGQTPGSHFALLVFVTVMFAWFGVSSFWRARRR